MKKKNQLFPRVAVISLSSPLEIGASKATQIIAEITKTLKQRKCEVIFSGVVSSSCDAVVSGKKLAGKSIDAVVFVPVCWFEDYLVLDFLEECNVPLLLWALPGMETGSLCGAQQLGCYLKYLGHSFHHVFGESGNAGVIESAIKFLKACTLKSRLRHAKIGIAGNHVNGMTHTATFEFALKKYIGPRVLQLYLPDIIESATTQKISDSKNLWANLKANVNSCHAKDADGVESINIYFALKEIVLKLNLDAITIGCYPRLMGKVCIAASLLAGEGIPFACEGDINGAVGQLILTLLSEQPTHNADWLEPLPDGSVVFTHCGSGSLSLAEDKAKTSLSPVRLMDHGTCVLFPSKPGMVTLLSLITNDNGCQVAMLQGEAVKTEMVFPGNPIRIKFEKSFKEINDWIFDEGIGHHWMIAYGDYAEEIRHFSKITGKSLSLKEV